MGSLIKTLFLALLLTTISANAKTVASINSKKITVDEFNRRYEQNTRMIPGEKPSKAEVLQNIVNFELAVQEAKKLKIHEEQRLKDQFDVMLYQEIVKRNIQPTINRIEIPPADIASFYKKNPLIRTSHIVFLSKPYMSVKEKKALKLRAQKVLKIVQKSKKSFEALAKEYSEGPTAKNGGDIDWAAGHKLLPEYYRRALALKKVGRVSGLVETPYGFHIIKLTGVRAYKNIDPVYSAFIEQKLKEAKGSEVFANYFESLKGKSKVTTDVSLLK